eukprot:Gregarina_sp_Pseudo_9__5660@NODE_79_length_4521_cov_38_581437_g73_i0_p4_GENE_NODE_79_length_4521_cov_38_581437_g73_i0NODE_79_length_4521_cov_38_581437_g73_i0_p4_ORF_typecomplete_len186_score35_19Sedlin_N/PF04628_13/6_3e10_NODE_79_length_4521_cov_38_581437_g73_i037558
MVITYVAYLNPDNQPVFASATRAKSGNSPSILVPNDDFTEADKNDEFARLVFQTLDAIDYNLKEQQSREGSSVGFDCYLGALGPHVSIGGKLEARPFGFVSSSKVKVVVIVERSEINPTQMKNCCRSLFRLYADSIANPFFTGSLESPHFLAKFEALVKHYSKAVVLESNTGS